MAVTRYRILTEDGEYVDSLFSQEEADKALIFWQPRYTVKLEIVAVELQHDNRW